jgi:hypothetical protein
MAKWLIWEEEQKKGWYEWITGRPQVIQDIAEKYNLVGDELYRLKTTGQRVMLHSLSEDGTITVTILRKYNLDVRPFDFDKRVFGINPADLEPCDLPEGVEPEVMGNEEE